MEKSNHPADQLAEIKTQIRNLKLIELDLKNQLLKMPSNDLSGCLFEARVQIRTQKRLNKDLLREKVGQQVMDDCIKVISSQMLLLSRKKEAH